MDLIQELVIIAKHIKQKKYSIAYENLSDMTSLLTASTVGETDLMLLELVFRDEIKNFDTSLKMLLNNESKVIEKNSGKNSEPNSG